MTKQEKIRISKKLKKAAYGMGFFYSFIFFTSRFFSDDYSFIASIIGSIVGGLVASYVYYLITKKTTFSILGEIERGLKGTVIPESRFESYVEIGEYFNKTSGKIFITDDYLIFKPNRFNNSANQPFDKIPLRHISSLSVEKPFFLENEKIKMTVKEKQFIISPLEECSEVIKYLKSA
jgi:hypothetical protein